MNRRDVAVLAFRVMAVYTLIQFVDRVIRFGGLISGSFGIIRRDLDPNLIGVGVVWAVDSLSTLAVGLILWFASKWLAGRVFAGTEGESAEDGADAAAWAAVAFTLIGANYLAHAVPFLIHEAALRSGGPAAITADTVRVLLGIFVMLGGGKLAVRLFRRDAAPTVEG